MQFFLLRALDALVLPLTLPSALVLKLIRRIGTQRLKWNRKLLTFLGVFPIRDHYYEPLFNPKHLKRDLRVDRSLPGIDFRPADQLALLQSFRWASELKDIPFEKPEGNYSTYFYHNASYLSGDAEYLYQMIRHLRPKRIVEVGCGFSTLMMRKALAANNADDPAYKCDHLCIEPYPPEWLRQTGARLLIQKVEEIEMDVFKALGANDILFIDSSHMIRPQGDVLFEYLEILPQLGQGVVVHVHDIFSPRDYLNAWIYDHVFFWNEQYLLEAFLSLNPSYKIIGALNYLLHHHPDELLRQCPGLAQEADTREPGAIWLRRC
jgi:hypothetical protein